jgi:DNA-binding transcriptional MocR family regulator
MRGLYGHRRRLFVKLFRSHLSEWLDPLDGWTGIQIASEFTVPIDDRSVVALAKSAGLNLAPLSIYFAGEPTKTGLLAGYAAVAERTMRLALPVLRRIVSYAPRNHSQGRTRSAPTAITRADSPSEPAADSPTGANEAPVAQA